MFFKKKKIEPIIEVVPSYTLQNIQDYKPFISYYGVHKFTIQIIDILNKSKVIFDVYKKEIVFSNLYSSQNSLGESFEGEIAISLFENYVSSLENKMVKEELYEYLNCWFK